MGETVYRLLFSEFDGMTDRVPIEILFGLVFAWFATKFVVGRAPQKGAPQRSGLVRAEPSR
jgi:hypothetical protein